MVITQARSRRKATGGRYISARKKRLGEIGRDSAMTKIDEKKKIKNIRTMGGNVKRRILRTNMANLLDPKTKKFSATVIKNVIESPSNRNYVRRNIITKGSIIETEQGKAKVTSRPGQDGTVNAVLIVE